MSTSYQYKKCLVTSLDVLGVKEMLHNTRSLDVLSALHNEFSQSIDEIREEDTEFCVMNPYRFKVFSDNIAIVKELSNNRNVAVDLHNLALFVMYFQSRLWCRHQLIVRGGIALGDCFIDELMVLGPGLVDAYNLESKVAIYPRVILSPQLTDYANSLSFAQNDFSVDGDGYAYVDYISFWNKHSFTNEEKEKHISFVRESLNNSKNESVKQKYLWMLKKIEVVTSMSEKK